MDTYLSLSSVIRGGCHAPVSPLFPPHAHTCKRGAPQGSIGGQKEVLGEVSRSGGVRRQGRPGGRLILILRGAPQASIGVQKKVGGGMSRTGGGKRSRPGGAGRRQWRLEGPGGMSLILMFEEIWARNLYVLVLLLCVCASECVFACVLIPYSPRHLFAVLNLKEILGSRTLSGGPGGTNGDEGRGGRGSLGV